MAHSRKAVFFDIDGTLIGWQKGPFAEDLEAIAAAVREGHLFFLNTGRSFANIPRQVLDLPLWSGVAAGAGAHVLLADPGAPPGGGRFRTIDHRWIPKETLCKLCGWYLERSKCLMLEGEDAGYVINPPRRAFLIGEPQPVTRGDDFETRYAGALISKLTMAEGISPEERELLEGDFRVNVFADYSEATLKGVSKATAMERLLEAVGIGREDSIAVGDSSNDLEMIRFAALGVAMGNGSPELKAAAAAITGDCGSGGAGQVVRKFVLGGR